MLRNLRPIVARFLKQEDGPTSGEYAVMLGVIILIGLTAYFSLSGKATDQNKSSIKKSDSQIDKTAR